MIGRWIAVVSATLIAVAVALGVSLSGGDEEWHVTRGALDADCNNSGANPDGSVQFMVPCPRSATSPDGRWKIVQTPATGGEEEIYDVLVEDASGRIIGSIPALNDHMPFVLRWSPRRDWFLINHYMGSGLERPRVFEITSRGLVEHVRFLKRGEDMARGISPCLPRAKPWLWVTGTGLRWSLDGHQLAWVFATRPDMCIDLDNWEGGPIPADKQWKPFLMISDIETGAVVGDSIRLLPDDGKWNFPTDGPYAEF